VQGAVGAVDPAFLAQAEYLLTINSLQMGSPGAAVSGILATPHRDGPWPKAERWPLEETKTTNTILRLNTIQPNRFLAAPVLRFIEAHSFFTRYHPAPHHFAYHPKVTTP
jgi:hypothetical protein